MVFILANNGEYLAIIIHMAILLLLVQMKHSTIDGLWFLIVDLIRVDIDQ